MTKQKNQKYFLGVAAGCIVAAILLVITPFTWRGSGARREISTDNVVNFDSAGQDGKFLYLSDVDYMPSSSTAYDMIRKDQVNGGGKITLRYENELRVFKKGYWAHATSNLDFDLRNYQEYDYLTGYVGVNTSAASVGSVRFCVFTSSAETINPAIVSEWGTALTPEQGATSCEKVATQANDAVFVKIPIKGVNYIRFHANSNGSNASDHAVYGDLKLVKADYSEDGGIFADLADLDSALKANGNLVEQVKAGDPNTEIALLRRNLISAASKWTLSQLVQQGSDEREMMNWLYNDVDALRMYTTGGAPTGTYEQSLAVLTQLYAAYKDDLNDSTRGNLYQKMMIAISLTHSKQVRFWIRDQGAMAGNPESPNLSRPLDRYAVYKMMYLNNKLQTAVFEQLEVEEMRYVMATELGDDEIEWLRDWIPTIGKGLYTYPPVPYISIGSHYWFDQNYDPNYIDPKSGKTWAERYNLIGANYTDGVDKSIAGNYKIGFEAKAPHLWMINYYGGVCWQISNFGQNVTASYGVPSTTFGQPGHLAYANYEMGNGVPAWALTNDVSGWSQSNFTGYTNINTYHPVRQMNNWGAAGAYPLLVGRYGYQGSYVTMAQAAINDFENYEKSQLLVKTGEVYGDDLAKQEEVYRQAITAQDFNFDAWYGIVANYIKQGNKTAESWYELAEQMTNSRMRSFALPYHDLMKTIIAQIPMSGDSVGYNLTTEMLLRRTLEWMANSQNASQIDIAGIFRQSGVTRTLANALLGRLNNEVAVFSFDGEDAGVLKLGEKYKDSNAAFDYSLDGGETWSSGEGKNVWVTEKRIKLTDEEIAKINNVDDIKVHIQGVTWEEKNFYTIDIKKGTLPNNLYANDKENRVIGVNTTMEWRTVTTGENNDKTYGEWMSYAQESPLRVGNIVIQVRVGATGVYLPSDASQEYKFTKDTDPETRRYIPVSHLSVAAVSSQALGSGKNGNAVYAIDGNFHTRWHSAWNGSDAEQWIVIKFDHLTYLSALGYVQAGGGNGMINEADIYVTSEENPNLANLEAIKSGFTHVGRVANSCEGVAEGVLCDAAWPMVQNSSTIENLNPKTFEFRRTEKRDVVDEEGNPVLGDGDAVKQEEVVTHEAIPVRYLMIKANKTSNGGKFVGARMFNFYEDKTKNPMPVAGIGYSTIDPTNGDVIARLINTSEDEIEVIDENGMPLGKSGFEHIFHENGEYTFRFRKVGDTSGQVGTAIAKVNWIMKTIADPKVAYICVDDSLDGDNQTTDCSAGNGKTNRSVSVRLIFPEEAQVKILNNGWQGGESDNDYDTEAPDSDEGDKPTDDKDENGDTVSKDENSLDPFTYLFMRNGRFTFEYEDAAGNKGSYTVQVDWIDKAAPKVDVEYSTMEPTDGEVVARLVSVSLPGEDDDVQMLALDDEELFVDGVYDENGLEYGEDFIMENGEPEYHFTKNGEYTFVYRDEAGNRGEMVAKVDWIREKQPDPIVPGGDDDDEETDNKVDSKPDDSGVEKPGAVELPGELPGGTPGNSGNNGQSGQNGSSANRPAQNRPQQGDTVANNNDTAGGTNNSIVNDKTVVKAEGLPEGARVESKRLALPNNLMAKYGSKSELYELTFVDADGKIPTSVKLPVTAGKTLEGVYIVKDDGTTEKVAFEKDNDGNVVLKSPKEGKYLFAYKVPDTGNKGTTDNDDESETEAQKRWFENPWIWGIGGVVAVVIVGVAVGMTSNRKR